MTLTIIDKERRYRRFLVYDLEWIPGTMELRMVGVYDGERYRSYRTIEAFLDAELTHANRGAWFYAHAGGLADFQYVLEAVYERSLHNRDWSIDAKFSGSSAIIAKVKHQRHQWVFLDSYWLFRDSLSSIGESLGMPKGEAGADPFENGITDEEYERRKRARRRWYASCSFEELRSYNEQDCRILWYAVDRFQSEVADLGGELQMTIASTGLNLFRRKYLKKNIEAHSYVNGCSMQAYAASRVEKYHDGVEDAYYYDINSSFPHAMTFPAPGEYLGSGWRLPEYDSKTAFLADCDIEVPDTDVPPLAYRLASRVFYPTGRWRAWFCSVDLEQLQKEGGRILAVHEVLKFATFDDLSGYANDMFNRRAKSQDPFQRIVYKYLMNCVYGKFAEMTEKDALLINPANTPITKKDRQRLRRNGVLDMHEWLPGAWIQTTSKAVPHRIVPIATHITAIARRSIGYYLAMSRDRYYCDTDGFCTKELWPTTKGTDDDPHVLGGLKLEKIIAKGHFAGSKGYHLQGFDEKGKPLNLVKFKGMSRMTVKRYMDLLEGETITMERMSRIRERLRKKILTPKEATVKKRVHFVSPYSRQFDARKHVVPKRFPYPDGSTRAWHVSELQGMLG
jgi:hypothetical protein